jgi:hypothetical protein
MGWLGKFFVTPQEGETIEAKIEQELDGTDVKPGYYTQADSGEWKLIVTERFDQPVHLDTTEENNPYDV